MVILLYFFIVSVYFGLIIGIIFSIIKWRTIAKQKNNHKMLLINNIVVLIIIISTIVYFAINSSVKYDVYRFEKHFKINIPSNYKVLSRKKSYLGPFFEDEIRLKMSNKNLDKFLISALKMKKYTSKILYKNLSFNEIKQKNDSFLFQTEYNSDYKILVICKSNTIILYYQ